MILSVSRRTDIPSHFSEWFLNRLEEGYVLTRNPMNYSQVSRITLSPDFIDCIVFWTKDPINMMDKLDVIDRLGYPYYFQFTLTPYKSEYEKNLRDKEDIIMTFRQLSGRIGKEKVLWRYDPIIINDRLTVDYHIERFTYLCNKLSGYSGICTISFVDLYKKLQGAVKSNIIKEISAYEKLNLASLLSRIGKSYGIELRACCETGDLSEAGIWPAACIDQILIERISHKHLSVKKENNQRKGCGCVQSVDIGVYNTCNNGCVYCYANYSEASVMKNRAKHLPTSDILIP